MKTIDEQLCEAPVDVAFRVAADVERWPDILPHYRWVTFRSKAAFGEGIVEMAAWRPFGPLKYPTWWLSEMTCDPDQHTVYYRHIGGITRGMDVRWQVREADEGGTLLRIVHEWEGPEWPVIGAFAADAVIGPHFIHVIASLTLVGIAREADALASKASS